MSDLEMIKNGVTVSVRVNTTSGKFNATVGDDHLVAETWAGMEKAVDHATKKVSKSVSVPFTSVTLTQGYGVDTGRLIRKVKHGTATGLHSGTGNILAKWDDTGEKFQLTGWNDGGRRFRPLSPDEITEYTQLAMAASQASEDLRNWETGHEIDLKKLVIKTLNEGAAPAN